MQKNKFLKLNIQFFANTEIADMINPEVMGDMISAELPKMIKFQGVAPIDATLQGQPGNTITLPKYEYIGDATIVAEGAPIDYTKMATSTAQHTIHKIAKGVELTDEAVLSGYGNPVGEAVSQIAMAIASTIDNSTLEALQTATLNVDITVMDPNVIDAVETAFNDEDESTGVLFVNPKDASKLRAAAGVDWTRASELGDDILVKGAFGEILGWLLVRTKKLDEGAAIAVKAGAAKTFLKRGLNPETERDITHKTTKFNADQHFVVGLVDDSKVVKVTVTP